MGYYSRVCEIAAQRYDQEVARGQQAGEQRTFYFGLLGGLVASIAAVVQAHGLVIGGSWNGWAFWIFVALASIGCLYSFVELLLAIRPYKIGYWPLPKSMREYADGCYAFHAASGTGDGDSAVEDDLNRVLAKRVEEVTEHNHATNNVRNARTSRCFYGLVLTGPFVLAMFSLSLMDTPIPPNPSSAGNQNMTENQNAPCSQPAAEPAPVQQPSAHVPAAAPAVSRPAEPQAVFITEGTKSAEPPAQSRPAHIKPN